MLCGTVLVGVMYEVGLDDGVRGRGSEDMGMRLVIYCDGNAVVCGQMVRRKGRGSSEELHDIDRVSVLGEFIPLIDRLLFV